jgi:hypothetical protein
MKAAQAPVPLHGAPPASQPILGSTERNRSMSHALKLATLIPRTEAPGSKGREVRPVVGSTTPSERLQLADAPVLVPFRSDSRWRRARDVQSPQTDQLKPSKPAGATTSEVSFGPFRLLPAQFLLLEGDKPVPLGSRAMQILIVLLERPGELVSKQDWLATAVAVVALPWARLLLCNANQVARAYHRCRLACFAGFSRFGALYWP